MDNLTQLEIKKRTNEVIAETIKQCHQKADDIDPAYAQLWQTIEKLMLAGGKRVRPYLTVSAYKLFSSTIPNDLYKIAAAQEFLHFALLIHDDIIDRDIVRYGQKNITGTYEDIYRADTTEPLHFANGAALMAGDLALSQAYTLINNTDLSLQQKTAAIRSLSDSIFKVAGGELLDMEATFRKQSTDYFTIAEYKTASYSFVGPLTMGANLANAPTSSVEHLKNYGTNIGIAYQLADDLLGVYGSEEVIGKPIVSDLREGKKTHFFKLIQKKCDRKDLEYFIKTWGNPEVTMEDVLRIRELGIKTGAKKEVAALMQEFTQRALISLSNTGLSSNQLKPLVELAEKALARTS